MKDVCNDNLSNTRGELFSPDIRNKITDRASTIEAFNKAIATVDKPTKSGTSNSRFFIQTPECIVRGQVGQVPVHPVQQIQIPERAMETKEESIATQDQTRTETLNSPVGGNLAHHLAAWNLITDNSWVLHYIHGTTGLHSALTCPKNRRWSWTRRSKTCFPKKQWNWLQAREVSSALCS